MGYNQQDAQEFLRYLLEGLHEDVNRIAVKPRPLDHDISDNLRWFSSNYCWLCVLTVLLSCQQRFRESHRVMEALLEEGRLKDRGPVCWPAQVDSAVYRVRPLQRDVWSLLGSLSAHPAVQQEYRLQRQVAPLPRSFCQRRNTRRRWKACKTNFHSTYPDSSS